MTEGIPEHEFEYASTRDKIENRSYITLYKWFFGKTIEPENIKDIAEENRPKAILWNLNYKPVLSIYDATIVQDIFTSKN